MVSWKMSLLLQPSEGASGLGLSSHLENGMYRRMCVGEPASDCQLILPVLPSMFCYITPN
jgi:hypothetical protein